MTTGQLPYIISGETSLPLAAAVERARRLLGEAGYGVLCEIDIGATFGPRLGPGAARRGAGGEIHISREAGVDYEHEPLEAGDVIEVGRVRIAAIATPGHRPEHMAFLIEDTSRAEEPWLLRAGVNDVEQVADGGVPMLQAEGIELVEGG